MNKSKRTIYLEKMLRWMAIKILKRHNPRIVGITGSVGKTSAKEAIYFSLRDNLKVRRTLKNYNNEIGVPLTIIGAGVGGKNIFKWLWVFLKWAWEMVSPFYPKILVLEMGVDCPGDMKYLMGFIPVEVAVLTDISVSHLEFFKSAKQIAKEKTLLAKATIGKGLAVLNTDNEEIKKFSGEFKGRFISIGFDEKADIFASDIQRIYDNGEIGGLSFKLNFQGKVIPFRLPNLIAEHQIYAVLSAVAVADYFKINLIETAKALEKFSSPKGRMNILNGKNGSVIIDDSYNASPISVLSAIKTLRSIMSKRKIVILGDMLELGEKTIKMHKDVLNEILNSGEIEILILVGDNMRRAWQEIEDDWEKDNKRAKVFSLQTFQDVNKLLQKEIVVSKGDLVLIKGSRAMQLEKCVL